MIHINIKVWASQLYHIFSIFWIPAHINPCFNPLCWDYVPFDSSLLSSTGSGGLCFKRQSGRLVQKGLSLIIPRFSLSFPSPSLQLSSHYDKLCRGTSIPSIAQLHFVMEFSPMSLCIKFHLSSLLGDILSYIWGHVPIIWSSAA